MKEVTIDNKPTFQRPEKHEIRSGRIRVRAEDLTIETSLVADILDPDGRRTGVQTLVWKPIERIGLQ